MRPMSTLHRLWGEVWRVALSLLLGAGIWAASTATIEMGEAAVVHRGWPLVDLALGLLACALVPLRRRWPLTIASATAVLTAGSVFAVAPATLVLISLSTRRRWREITIVAVLSALAWTVLSEVFYPVQGWAERTTNATVSLAFIAASIALGAFIGGRREYVRILQERAETAEREQASRVAEARATERSRIAREMHDVLAHRISLIAMHAGALAYREDLPPDQVRQVAGLLRDNSDQAVQEMRQVLGVLRGVSSDPADEPLAPQPSLARLADLAAEVRAAGSPVDITVALDGDPPITTSRTAYRIVQEALTNARKHATGSPVTVTVTGGLDAGVSIIVRNEPPGPAGERGNGSGMGLIGLTERAVLAGGTLSYGTDRAGRFVLRSWLPWAHETPASGQDRAPEPVKAPAEALVEAPAGPRPQPWVPPSPGALR